MSEDEVSAPQPERSVRRSEEERVGRIGLAVLQDLAREQRFTVRMKRRINKLVLFEDLGPGPIVPGQDVRLLLPDAVAPMSQPEASDPPEVQLLFERRDAILAMREDLERARELYEESANLDMSDESLFAKRESLMRSIAKLEATIAEERKQMDGKMTALRDLFERRYSANVKMVTDMRRTTIQAKHSETVFAIHRERIAMDERTRLKDAGRSGSTDLGAMLAQLESVK